MSTRQWPMFGRNRCYIEKLERRDYGLFFKVKIDCENVKSFHKSYSNKLEEDSFAVAKDIFSVILGKKVVEKEAKGKTYLEFLDSVIELLPDDLLERQYEVFLQWQSTYPKDREGKEYDKTFLEIPLSLKYGKFFCPKLDGYKWNKLESFNDETKNVLTYVNKEGDLHPFVRDGWFMLSRFANRQAKDGQNDQPKAETKSAPVVEDDDLPF